MFKLAIASLALIACTAAPDAAPPTAPDAYQRFPVGSGMLYRCHAISACGAAEVDGERDVCMTVSASDTAGIYPGEHNAEDWARVTVASCEAFQGRVGGEPTACDSNFYCAASCEPTSKPCGE